MRRRRIAEFDPARHPVLRAALDARIVWPTGEGEYVGHAADGVLVNFGLGADSVESYLAEHPTPETW